MPFSSITVAIDPGRDGAIVGVDPDGVIQGYRLLGTGTESVQPLREFLSEHCCVVDEEVVIERNASAPGQSVTSAFTQGENYGILCGALRVLGWGLRTIEPSSWHKLVPKPKGPKYILSKRNIWDSAELANPSVFRGLSRHKAQGLADAYYMALAEQSRRNPPTIDLRD